MTDTTATSAFGLPRLGRFDIIASLCSRLHYGSLTLTMRDGKRYEFTGREPGPAAALTITGDGFAGRLLAGGEIGFAEAWIDGICDSPDLVAFIELAALNGDAGWAGRLKGHMLPRMIGRLHHRMRSNTRRGARRNILAHYDLGNDFYGHWLDETMTYSSAVFDAADGDTAAALPAAQQRKYRRLAEIAGIGKGDRVLEIGCGWGGFAEFAAAELGCHVTAVTISDAQHAFATRRIAEAGLAGRVDIRKCDYRDLTGRFDRIVSIEMFEAVGERYWPVYFERLNALLEPGGRAALQVITIDENYFESYRRDADFIQRYIFPGGMLPTVGRLAMQADTAGLRWHETHAHGADYARTLMHWQERFLENWDAIAALGFGDEFRRLWTYYLSYCIAGFRIGRIDVHQIGLQKA
jgi:cyclopropane-fatty-acyl-phospholipid synthase